MVRRTSSGPPFSASADALTIPLKRKCTKAYSQVAPRGCKEAKALFGRRREMILRGLMLVFETDLRPYPYHSMPEFESAVPVVTRQHCATYGRPWLLP